MSRKHLIGLLVGLASAACTPSAGTGSLVVTIAGEGAVDGFPLVEDGETIALADDWTIAFSKVVASVGRLSIAASDGEVGFEGTETYVVDLHADEEVTLATVTDLEARRWDRVGYELVPATTGATNVNGVAQGDLDAMVAAGANYLIEGTATKGSASVAFRWLLANPTRNADCTNGNDDKQGVVVVANSTAEAQITLHLEHLFWTRLGTHASNPLRFDPIAAVAGDDGVVTLDELATQSLEAPLDANGERIRNADATNFSYDPGSISPAPQNLRDFVLAATSTQGHLNGEGLCTITRTSVPN